MASPTSGKPTLANGEMATLGTTRHEQASALLSSVLLLLGVMTTGMLLAWLAGTIVWDRPVAPVKIQDAGGGSFGNSLTGGAKELDAPGPEEAREVVVEEKVEHALESIAGLVSSEGGALDEIDPVGSRSPSGPRGPGPPGVPSWDRWEIKFAANKFDTNVYAQQLDFFKVELGVAGGGVADVDYCSNFSATTPTRRSGKPKDEKRLHFLHRKGELRQADRDLAAKAGIEVTDRIVFQFYTPEMYTRLLTLENQKKGTRRITEVKKTTFGLRGPPGKWEFYVLDQQYRPPLPSKS